MWWTTPTLLEVSPSPTGEVKVVFVESELVRTIVTGGGSAVVGLLILIIYWLSKGKLVWGTELERERAEKEEWKNIALDTLGVAEEVTGARKTTAKAKKRAGTNG